MEYKDYYKIMGVGRDASAEDIKRAHRKLARKYHPDVSKEKDAEARFKDISEAYEVLRDPEKRAAYDQLGANWRAGQDFRPPPGWNTGTEHPGKGFEGFDWSFQNHRPGGRGSEGDFSDFFETLFRHGFAQGQSFGEAARRHTSSAGSGAGAQARRRQTFNANGEDHHAKILIDLEDAYQGATRTVNLHITETDAIGRTHDREHQVTFQVPKGIRAGQHIRLTGQGESGSGHGRAGDLYLEVEFKPRSANSPNYRVDKHDVYLDLPITPWEAALGAKVEAHTPTGKVEVTIPSGSTTGKKLRLKGRGIPGNVKDSPAGDFYFVLQVLTPPAETDKAKSFYQEMAQQFKHFRPRAP